MRLILLLFACILIQSTAATAKEKAWQFPWPQNYIKLNVKLDSEDLDGSESTRLYITGQDGFKMGGALSSIWSVTSGKGQSMNVKMLYRPDVKTWFYLYAKPSSIPMDNAKAFRAYAERIVKKAEKDKSFKIEFDLNEDEELRIYPEIPESHLARFKESGVELTDVALSRLRPRLFGNVYYQLEYDTVQNDVPVKGSLVFVDVDDWVLCYEIETNADGRDYPRKSLSDFLAHLYVEDRYIDDSLQVADQPKKVDLSN
ncbi:hypothetical protein [Rubellicoccus peritrichatus]|uniref:Uncharacterized protein n=1 Tax=Rubellicoccus peritrichatus TaxID=3080537 RepID=A0AAQ3LAI6_9BACT|nr:hypothetical protein [Puniceicoccus sp. CR14]WOO39943.1 hypothetical protein RZN69_15055 [Puniceicoccus sp. CR14]